MNQFSLVVRADAEVLREIDGWLNRIEIYLRGFFNRERERIRGTRFGDNIAKVTYIAERVVMEPNAFRGVRDVQNRLQAGAIVEEEIDCLYVDAFASAPWNILGNQPETIRGAGTTLMEELVKESLDLGFEGRIKLFAIERALSFYTRIGFTKDEDGTGGLELTPIAAKRFLERLLSRRRSENQ